MPLSERPKTHRGPRRGAAGWRDLRILNFEWERVPERVPGSSGAPKLGGSPRPERAEAQARSSLLGSNETRVETRVSKVTFQTGGKRLAPLRELNQELTG